MFGMGRVGSNWGLEKRVSNVSGPKCGAAVHKGLRAWEQERGKNRNATPKTAFGATPASKQNVSLAVVECCPVAQRMLLIAMRMIMKTMMMMMMRRMMLTTIMMISTKTNSHACW